MCLLLTCDLVMATMSFSFEKSVPLMFASTWSMSALALSVGFLPAKRAICNGACLSPNELRQARIPAKSVGSIDEAIEVAKHIAIPLPDHLNLVRRITRETFLLEHNEVVGHALSCTALMLNCNYGDESVRVAGKLQYCHYPDAEKDRKQPSFDMQGDVLSVQLPPAHLFSLTSEELSLMFEQIKAEVVQRQREAKCVLFRACNVNAGQAEVPFEMSTLPDVHFRKKYLRYLTHWEKALSAIGHLPLVTVMHITGSGTVDLPLLQLAFACDLRYLGSELSISLNVNNFKTIAGSLVFALSKHFGTSKARNLCLYDQAICASDAEAQGLVHGVANVSPLSADMAGGESAARLNLQKVCPELLIFFRSMVHQVRGDVGVCVGVVHGASGAW
jgi:enoyl-CoA hydratase/carnithine racemase